MPILGYSVLEDLRHKFGSYKRLYEIKFMDGVFTKEHVSQYREMIKKLDAKVEELQRQGAKANWREIKRIMVREGNDLCECERYQIPPVHYAWKIPEVVMLAILPEFREISRQPESFIGVQRQRAPLPYAQAFYFPPEFLTASANSWDEGKLEVCGNRNLLLLLEFGLPPRWTRESLVIKDVALTALPTWVLQVQGLQELVLESTGMTGLYPNLGALTSVTRLVMRNQPLQNLDFVILAELAKKVPVVVIEETKSLMWTHITPALLIGEQSMSAFDVGSLLNLEKLKSLELEKCNLIDTSFIVSRNFNLSSLAQLSCLEHLSLNANNLTRVPGFVSHLPNLKFLGLYGNQLQSMQQSIGVLTQLQKLECINLSKNKLKDMSFLRKLTTLPNLQNIRLLHNQIPIATDHEHWEIQGRTILIELEGNPKRPRPLSISHTIAPRTPPAPTPAGMFDVIEQYLSRWWE
jgi:hypothetical protein